MTAITTTWMKNKVDYEFDDCNPNHNIAFGNKAGDITASSQHVLKQLSVTDIVKFMMEYFKQKY